MRAEVSAIMTEPREKILGLVASGKISPSEAELLLGALKPARGRVWTWLSSPFELATPAQVWAVALVTGAGSLALRPFHLRFDGALDLHLVEATPRWGLALLDQLVAWPLTALVFWAIGLLSRQRVRLLDLLAFVGAARLPQLLAALTIIGVISTKLHETRGAGLIVPALVLPLIGWTCLLLFSAFRTATGSQGGKLKLSFFAAIVLAEVASKLCLGLLS
jgi:hypothetical protein